MHALLLNATLKKSPDTSNTGALADYVAGRLAERGATTEMVRLVDHVIEPGVVSEALSDRDEWPAIRAKILAADILVLATPTWLGQISSEMKRALERMDAVLSETDRERCRTDVPALDAKAPMQFVACHFPEARADIASGEDLGITGDAEPGTGATAM